MDNGGVKKECSFPATENILYENIANAKSFIYFVFALYNRILYKFICVQKNTSGIYIFFSYFSL